MRDWRQCSLQRNRANPVGGIDLHLIMMHWSASTPLDQPLLDYLLGLHISHRLRLHLRLLCKGKNVYTKV